MRVSIESTYPLAPLQEGLLFHALAAPESEAYINQLAFPLVGDLNEEAFADAWRWLLERHTILRTAFTWKKGKRPMQSVLSGVRLPLVRLDWRELPASVRETQLQEFLVEDRARGFDLSRPPLFRLTLIRLDEETTYVVKTHHHLILDGWSSAMVRQELTDAYAAFATGEMPQAPPAGSYEDFISWIRRKDLRAAEDFWRGEFADLEAPGTLRGGGVEADGGFHQEAFSPDADFVSRLETFARGIGITANTVVQAAWGLALARLTGSSDVVFGTTVSGRPPELATAQQTVGLFINTIPVRVRIDPARELRAWLQELQTAAARAREFEYAPLSRVQVWAGRGGGEPLFETLVVFENYPGQATSLADEPAVPAAGVFRSQATHYPLTLVVLPGEGLRMELCFDGKVLDRAAASGLVTLLAESLEGLMSETAECVGDALGAVSVQRPVPQRGTEPLWTASSMQEAFARHVSDCPDAPALRDADRIWSYADLDAASTRLAVALHGRGVVAEDRVGVFLPRSCEAIVALLGVLKAGAAYVPLDPEYPAARLAHMQQDAGVRCVISAGQAADKVPDGAIALAELLAEPADVDAVSALPKVQPDQLALVLYTSGSTGVPKGVALTHRGVLRTVLGAEYTELNAQTALAHASTLSFDAATFEIWGPLLNGGSVRPLSRLELLDADRLIEIFSQDSINMVFLTTALFQHYARSRPDVLDCVDQVLFGGERVDPAVVQALRPRRRENWLRHLYGPCETTTFGTWDLLDTDSLSGGTVPIGRPVMHTDAFIVDRWGTPMPDGLVGDLCLGGIGLARGYLGSPGATAERFLPHPQRPTERIYRTGDLVRRNARGAIEFVGRVDAQIKIRGFRIEPMELEVVLQAQEGILQAAVVVAGEGADRHLVAFLVTEMPDPAIGELRRRLAELLPAYLLPARLERISELPLGPAGKVDRRRLLESLPTRSEQAGAEAPRTRLEQIIADIWSQMLGRDQVGVHDDFFDLGGHSILAVQVVERIRAAVGGSRDVPLTAIFQARTVADLSALYAGMSSQASPLVPLRAAGKQPPLFCFHPAGGHVTGYRRLVAQLPRGFPVFGLQSRGLLDARQAADSIEAMADDYAEVIREQCPDGPYRLLGWSMGGEVALATAARLEALGGRVTFVGLVDTPWAPGSDSEESGSDLVDRMAAQLGAHPEHQALASLSGQDRAKLEQALAGMASEQERLEAALKFAHDSGFLSRNVSVDILRIRAAALERASEWMREHQRQKIAAPLDIWCAGDRLPDESLVESWGALTQAGAQVTSLAGDHLTIIESAELAAAAGIALSRE